MASAEQKKLGTWKSAIVLHQDRKRPFPPHAHPNNAESTWLHITQSQVPHTDNYAALIRLISTRSIFHYRCLTPSPRSNSTAPKNSQLKPTKFYIRLIVLVHYNFQLHQRCEHCSIRTSPDTLFFQCEVRQRNKVHASQQTNRNDRAQNALNNHVLHVYKYKHTHTHCGLIRFKLLYTRKLRQPGTPDKIENKKNEN